MKHGFPIYYTRLPYLLYTASQPSAKTEVGAEVQVSQGDQAR
jgi:hypothetical protein